MARANHIGDKVADSKQLQSWLAKYLIQLKEGDRLMTVRELANAAGASVGSISAALNYLEEINAVKLERRGSTGSHIAAHSLGELWKAAEQLPFVIAWTLPTHLRFEALATGFRKVLTQAGIPSYLIFVRGSHTRLQALRENRCQTAIMSYLSAVELCTANEAIMLSLPPSSWISSYYVFFRTQPSDRKRLRVGIDYTSFDEVRVTMLEFAGKDVEFVSASYLQEFRLLKSGFIDAMLSTSDQIENYASQEIGYRPLSDTVSALVADKAQSAALVGNVANTSVRAVLQALDAQQIVNIQNRVLANEIIPEY